MFTLALVITFIAGNITGIAAFIAVSLLWERAQREKTNKMSGTTRFSGDLDMKVFRKSA